MRVDKWEVVCLIMPKGRDIIKLCVCVCPHSYFMLTTKGFFLLTKWASQIQKTEDQHIVLRISLEGFGSGLG